MLSKFVGQASLATATDHGRRSPDSVTTPYPPTYTARVNVSNGAGPTNYFFAGQRLPVRQPLVYLLIKVTEATDPPPSPKTHTTPTQFLAGFSFKDDGVFVQGTAEHAIMACVVHHAGRHYLGEAAGTLDQIWALVMTAASGKVPISPAHVQNNTERVVR